MILALGHFCAHTGLIGPGEPREDGEMSEMTVRGVRGVRTNPPFGAHQHR